MAYVVYSLEENKVPLLDVHSTPEGENMFMHRVWCIDENGDKYTFTSWELLKVGEVLDQLPGHANYDIADR